jgi:acetylornithine/succinyldiaminopimelate/putrescine aminotransferase
LTAKAAYREPFGPLLPDVRFLPFNDAAAARAAIGPEVCAVFVEPVQGEGGVTPANPEFLRVLRRACDAADALLVFDEVQCGLGRSGKLWAHEALGPVRPDMMTVAKPLAGGLPIGALLTTERLASVLTPGTHGSTFAGGPLICRAACEVLDRIAEPAFLQKVELAGEHLRQRLAELQDPRILEPRGLGLLLGLAFDRPIAPLLALARLRGLLIISAGPDVLRLAPPLIISSEEIDQAVAILAESLAAWE